MNISFNWIWLFFAPAFSGLVGAALPTPSSLAPHRVAWSTLMACFTLAFTLPMWYEYPNAVGPMHIVIIAVNIAILSIFVLIIDHFRASILDMERSKSAAFDSLPKALQPDTQNNITITNRAALLCVLVSYAVLIANVVIPYP
jgi:hypothetical protein